MTTGSNTGGRSRAILAVAVSATVVLVAAGIAVGCTAPDAPAEKTASSRQALASTNGLSQNGLTTNGLVSNGAWFNGAWFNGAWFNGAWFNGAWFNGAWFNGAWFNGAWFNGAWFNGIFSNNLWSTGIDPNGGPPAVGSPAAALQSSPYLRQLLPYIYGCAMPGALDPITNTPIDPTTYDTTLDPNNGTLKCAPPGAGGEEAGAGGGPACDVGYTCSPQGTCVIALHGQIGLAINKDGSSWWGETAAGAVAAPGAIGDGGVGDGGVGGGAGTCDESCQRWVSACVLARTNAYGAHVEISMRAPADAPQAVKNALATSPGEVETFALREGAYYGNIFETAPVPSTPPAPGYTGPASGPVVQQPAFYACAGPESNVPEITKRFCSSQGDQVVINVPGVCLANTTDAGVTEPGACAGQDTDAGSPTFGAIQDCFTSTNPPNPRQSWQPPPPQPPVEYQQVITVFLKQPIAVCGNGVCETGEDVATDPACGPSVPSPCSCPSDCHPGSWAKDLPYLWQQPGLLPSTNTTVSAGNLSAITGDGDIVVAGTVQGDVDLGGGTLPASQGRGVLAKYDPQGHYLWGLRFGGRDTSAAGGELRLLNGVTLAPNGNLTVVGAAVAAVVGSDGGSTGTNNLWIATYDADGGQPDAGLDPSVGTWSLPIDTIYSPDSMSPTRGVAFDADGNIIVAVEFSGTATFGSTTLVATEEGNPDAGAFAYSTFIAKFSPKQGAWLWARNLGAGPTGSRPLSLATDSAGNLLVTGDFPGGKLQKLSPDGSTVLWAKTLQSGDFFQDAIVDENGDVYASGYFASGEDLGGGPITGFKGSPIVGQPPFLVKYGSDGSYQWASYANLLNPSIPNASAGLVVGGTISIGSHGDVILVSRGAPPAGGGIDFGIGPFPTYSEPNIFLAGYSQDAGRFLWAQQIPTILSGTVHGVTIDNTGRLVMTGEVAGSLQVDGQLLVCSEPEQPSSVDSFLASFAAPSAADQTPPCIGNIGTCSSPSITVPSDIVAPATSQCGANVFFMPPTAIDPGDPDVGAPPAAVQVACSPRPNTIFPIGAPTTVTCTATDAIGNRSSASFNVTVVDTVPPVLSNLPVPAPVQATGPSGASVTYQAPSATDQVDCSSPSSSNPPCMPTRMHASRPSASRLRVRRFRSGTRP